MTSDKIIFEEELKDTKKQLERAMKSLNTFKTREESLTEMRRERNEMQIQNRQLVGERDRAVARYPV